jgi:hypothetical protein
VSRIGKIRVNASAPGGTTGVIPMTCFSNSLPVQALALLVEEEIEKLGVGHRSCRTPFWMHR